MEKKCYYCKLSTSHLFHFKLANGNFYYCKFDKPIFNSMFNNSANVLCSSCAKPSNMKTMYCCYNCKSIQCAKCISLSDTFLGKTTDRCICKRCIPPVLGKIVSDLCDFKSKTVLNQLYNINHIISGYVEPFL